VGTVLKVHVTAANISDREGGAALLLSLAGAFPRLVHGWVDAAYRGLFLGWVQAQTGITLEVVERRDGGGKRRWLPADADPPVVPRFAVVPRRWVVERTFGWLIRNRRLSRDYERLTGNSEAMIKIAMIRLMATRLAGEQVRWSNRAT
jgi:putative transposase